jgi:hypothetical protein
MTLNSNVELSISASQCVLGFINALNAENFEKARTLVSEDLKFIGVMGTRDGAEAYFKDMEKMKLKYRIKKVFADDNDVCLFYDIDISGKTIFASGWYQTENGRIKSFQVVFDPRPLLGD